MGISICSIPLCKTRNYRKPKSEEPVNYQIFSVKDPAKAHTVEGREHRRSLVRILLSLRDPRKGDQIKTLIQNGRAGICERHFNKSDIYLNNVCKRELRLGALPVYEMPKILYHMRFKQRRLPFKQRQRNKMLLQRESRMSMAIIKKRPITQNLTLKWDQSKHPTFGKNHYKNLNDVNLRKSNEDFEGHHINEVNRTICLKDCNIVRPSFESTMTEEDTEVIVLPLTDPPVKPEGLTIEENTDLRKVDLINIIHKFKRFCVKFYSLAEKHVKLESDEDMLRDYSSLLLAVDGIDDIIYRKRIIKIPSLNYEQNMEKKLVKITTKRKFNENRVPMSSQGIFTRKFNPDGNQLIPVVRECCGRQARVDVVSSDTVKHLQLFEFKRSVPELTENVEHDTVQNNIHDNIDAGKKLEVQIYDEISSISKLPEANEHNISQDSADVVPGKKVKLQKCDPKSSVRKLPDSNEPDEMQEHHVDASEGKIDNRLIIDLKCPIPKLLDQNEENIVQEEENARKSDLKTLKKQKKNANLKKVKLKKATPEKKSKKRRRKKGETSNGISLDGNILLDIKPPFSMKLKGDPVTLKRRIELQLLKEISVKNVDEESEKDFIKFQVEHKTWEIAYKCEVCDKLFQSWKRLRSHDIDTHQKVVECKICSKFYTRHSIRGHRALHNKRFICETCGAKFVDNYKLVAHTTYPSACALQNTECQVCEERFCSLADAKKHMLQCHCNNETCCGVCSQPRNETCIQKHLEVILLEPYECIHCDQRFNKRYTLLKHLRSSHVDAFKFPCDICNKRFRTVDNMKLHKVVHTTDGSSKFLCEYCCQSFSSMTKLREHTTTYHQNDL